MFSIDADKLPPPLQANPVAQVAFIVPNLARGIALWNGILGISDADWLIYTYGPENVPELSYKGAPGQFRMQLALAGHGPQIELIQPIDGPSIYHEWRDKRGYGLHHLGFRVPSIRDAMFDMSQYNAELIQSGSGYGVNGDGGFAYYDTLASVGVIVELIEVPAQRRPSETTSF